MRFPALLLSALLVGAWGAGAAFAAPVIYDDEATFKAQLLTPKTYDFEAASGFPEASYMVFPYIGLHDNIQFEASTY